MSVKWQPVRSLLTGNQLAAEVEEEIAGLREQIKTLEARVAGLLA